MNKERLQRIRNFQSDDWYAALLLRPLCILIMLVVADWAWLTPNLVTTLSSLCKLAGAAVLFQFDREHVVLAVVLLQVGTLLDHLDGTIARYRGTGSSFGAFYDKVSDAITWFVITGAIGWVAYQRTGDAAMIVLCAASAYALLATGYMKWVNATERAKLDWLEARGDPAAAVARHTAPRTPATPPERTGRDWVIWFFKSLLQVYRFEEIDLFFWVGLFLLLDEPAILCWLLGVSQVVALVVMLVKRVLEARAFDRDRRRAATAGG